ncbi:MAG: flagellar biosynthesis protein FlhF, partial [Gammaproteobacteria bacterium]|nr:flagellar biosynthesis protein FlhF [Gammaproteobacteria bacterium]
AVSLGGVISTLVRSRMPVAYLSDGPRIPEDLRPARAPALVARAAELARAAGTGLDPELLAQHFGGRFHAAA